MAEQAQRDILEFWFGDTDASGAYDASRGALWFGKSDDTDRSIRERFGGLVRRGAAGELDDWASTAQGRIALILLLDQFTRNIFRGSGDMYQADDRALRLALEGIERGHDDELHPVQRLFMYLPLEHSEELSHQEQSVKLCQKLAATITDPELKARYDDFTGYAEAHRDIIAQWGRFPHRNALLGRESTPEEQAFLAKPGSSF